MHGIADHIFQTDEGVELYKRAIVSIGGYRKVPAQLEFAYQARCAALSARSTPRSYLEARLLLKTTLDFGYAKCNRGDGAGM